MQPARARGLGGGSGHRTRGLFVGALLLAVTALLALCPSAMALAQRGHALEQTFGSTGSEAGQMLEPKGVAINEATGDIYVVDSGNNRVDRFDREGKFIEAWGFGVKDGVKAFETCTTECRKGLAGHQKGAFHGAEAIAIDNAPGSPSKGDVYVEAIKPYEEEVGSHEIEFEKTVYDKFSPSGKLEAQIKGWKEKGESIEPFEEPHGITVDSSTGAVWIYNEEELFKFSNELKNKFVQEVASEAEEAEGRQGLAVDSSGDLYVEHESESAPPIGTERASVVAKLDPIGAVGEVLINELNGEDSTGVAVDPSTQSVLVDNIGQINVYSSSGALIDSFGSGQIGHGGPLAAAGTGEPGASVVAVTDTASNSVHLFGPEPPGVPKLSEVSVAGITSTTAHLTASIDPTGLETEYSFRYSTEPLPASTDPCAGACRETSAAGIGSGFSDVPVEPEVTGLAPGTRYHYELTAQNSAGPVASTEQTFKTAPEVFGATLPDSRQWQMVSPPNKNGALIPPLEIESEVVQASPDGNAFTYVSQGVIPGAEGSRAPELSQILSRRTGTEWVSTPLEVPHEESEGLAPSTPYLYRWFTPDLSEAALQPFGTEPSERPPLNKAAAEKTPYTRSNAPACLTPPFPEECYAPIVTAGNVPEVEGKRVEYGGKVNFVAGTPNLDHTILSSAAQLAAGGTSKENLYEETEGDITLVSVLPNGEPATKPRLGFESRNVRNAISEDGSKVVFEQDEEHLYVRDLAKKETVKIDEPQPGVTEPPLGTQKPSFQIASPDGSHIFFTDRQRLTKDSTSSSKLLRPDLYECIVAENEAGKLECQLHDLTVDSHVGESANVQGLIMGSNTEATTFYFVANGALTPDASSGNCRAGEEGQNQGEFVLTPQCNLYMDRYNPATETWNLTLVTRLSAEDEPDWQWTTGGQAEAGNLGTLTSRVSEDGNWLTFMSVRSLTGYNTRDVHGGRLDEQVYSYEASTGKTRCVSCDPNGARPTGVFNGGEVLEEVRGEETEEGIGLLVDRPRAYKERWLSAIIPGWTHLSKHEARYASRVIGDSGRMFFMSNQALVPQDTNGKMDVYEFEPAGVGGCTSASETFQEPIEGCVSLISSGKSPREAAFLDATPSGNDVFFVTTAALAPRDPDAAWDVYDASVCGIEGSPACLPEPAATPKPCESVSECRTATNTPPPDFGTPATFKTGPSGNIAGKTSVLPSTEEKPKTTPKPLTRAQKLAKALKACKKVKSKSKRNACEKSARKRYGAHKASNAKKAASRRRGR